MSEPLEITTALEQIEHASNPNRQLARERIARFRLDKDKGEKPLPTVNLTTGSGAPLLDRDAVLRRSYPNYAEKDK